MKNSRLTKGIASAAFVLAALGAGTAIIGAASANAATNDTPNASASATSPDPNIVTAAGDMVIMQVGADFTVTGTQTGGPGGSGGAPDANGAPTAPPAAGTAPTAPASSSA